MMRIWSLLVALLLAVGCTDPLPVIPKFDATSMDGAIDKGGIDAARDADVPDMSPDSAIVVDMAPPPVDMAPPPVDMAPPPVDMAPPPVDMAPQPIDMANPMDMDVELDMSPPCEPDGPDDDCDGVDDDCDNRIDEESLLGQACSDGVGACLIVGVHVCREDQTVGCNAVAALPVDEVRCDGVDNDCDEQVDEGEEEVCLAGPAACRGEGVRICADGDQICDAETPSIAECVTFHRDRLVSGNEHRCLRYATRQIKCWGSNEFGQLGLGDNQTRGDAAADMGDNLPFVPVGGPVEQLALGSYHTCALLDAGAVKCWGRNASGQLGQGTNDDRGDEAGELEMMQPVALGAPATAIAAGLHHTCALIEGGAVKCWGQNDHGQLGLGDRDNRGDAPNQMGAALLTVPLDEAAVQIAAHTYNTCAVLQSGAVKCWGANSFGQLGQGDTDDRGDEPNEIGAMLAAVPLAADVIKVVPGASHVCALLVNGSIQCWGDSQHGQLGQGNQEVVGDDPDELANLPIVDIAGVALDLTADRQSCAALLDGRLKCWGYNEFGVLGLGDMNNRGDQPDEMGDQLVAVELGERIVGAAAGPNSTCALLEDGEVKCWGHNDTGNLGLGEVGGRRGDAPDEMGANLPAVDLGGAAWPPPVPVFAQRCAGEVDCLVDDDPECAGDRICLPHGRWSACQLDAANDNEQCRNPNACVPSGQPDEQCDGIDDDCDGLLDEAVIGRACIAGPAACQRFGETTCVDGAAGCSARAATVAECHLHRHGLVSAGGEHSCAIAGNGQVKCWGFNDEGQLGIGDRANRGDAEGEMGQGLPVAELDGRAVIVSAGRNHTCALLEGGAVKCWGNSDSGRLGLGDLENRGDGPGEMGADLEPVPLGGPALALASGAYHNCVIMDGGVVKCWGQNEMGQLGLGDQGSRGDSPGEVSPELMAVPLEQEAIAIVAGERHSCALLIGGDVKCWGWNVDGQLGQGDSRNRGDAADELGPNLQSIPLAGTAVGLAAGTYHTCAVMEGGAVKCWGANRHGQLAHVNQANSVGDEAGEMGEALPALELGGPALSVTAGIDHTCALMESGVVQCWGGNDEGQLGLGDLQDRPAPNPVPLNALAVAVSAGDRHNCALLVDGRVRCWGKGANGQLGQGSNQNIGDAADELGEALEPIDVGALSGVDVEIPACDGAEICNGIDDDCDGLIDDGALADGPCVAGFGPACQRVGVLSCDAEEGVACSAVAPTIEECAQRQISLAARNHTCVIGVDGQLRCWGPNSSGQLGIGLDVEIWGTAEGQMGENLPAVDAGGDVLQVTAGGDFTCALLVPGVVKCWGNNQVGQLGGGAREDRGDQAEEMGDSLVPVDLAGTAVAIDAGERHVCALLEDQSVKCWGQNGYGQLAQGDRLSRGINAIEMGENLHAVPLGLPIAQITAGAGHNCALSSDGQVLCWGLNRNGQLGVGDIEDRGDDEEELQQLTQPVPLPMPASSIDAGGGHTCALLVDGSAYCWGSAAYGEIGSGDRNNRGDDLIEIGALQPVALGEPAVAISAGGSNSCALFANGALKCWGGNGAFAGGARGKLGLGDQENRGDEPDELGENLPRVPLPLPVVGVEVGRGHVCAVLVDGSIRCWGAGSALGRESSDFIGDDPGEVEQLAAIELGIELSFEEPQRGECLGSPECIVADMQAQCSEGRSACLPSGNRSYCYSIAEQQDEACNGLDDDCDGTVDEQAADVGGDCATAQQGVCGRGSWACIGGELECLPGYEATPEVCNLEDDDCDGEVDEDTLAGDACEAGPVACRSEGTCVEQAGCSVEMPAISECATRLPATLGLTGDGGCVIVEQGQVRCWGRGIYGHLGTGNTDNLGDEPNELGEALNAIALNVEAVGIDCGEGHCCVTTPANLLKCWGNNYVGQLGLGDNNPRGDNPNELGDQLPVVPFARPVLEFTTGGIHTCALFDDGARCWGDNAYGQLGYGDRVRRGIEPNEIRDLAPIGIGIQIEHIQAGFGHTCAIVAGGGVRCWGQNNDGQLGLGDRERRGDEAGEMLDIADVPLGAAARKLALGSAHTCALLTTGEVVCWGGNAFGQLGIGSTEHVGISAASVARPLQRVPLPEPALDVVAERGHTCALLEGGAVQCWGRNEFGQLGIEGRAQIGDDPGETESGHWLVRLPERAIQIRAGNNHVCAILESGRAGCWGANNFGQLGLGNTISRGLLPGDLGEGMQFIDLGAEIHFEPLNE